MLPVQRVAIVTMEHPAESAGADLPCDDTRNVVVSRHPSGTKGLDPLTDGRVCAGVSQRKEREEVTMLNMSDNSVQAKITPGDDRISMAKITPNDGTEGLNPLLIKGVCAGVPTGEIERATIVVSSDINSQAQSMQGYDKEGIPAVPRTVNGEVDSDSETQQK